MFNLESVVTALQSASGAGPVLSLYLHVDPARGLDGMRRQRALALVEGLRAALPDDAARRGLTSTAEVALAALDAADTARGTALFADSTKVLALVSLPAPVASAAYFADTPNVRPLIAALDEYEHTAIVLIDKERVRLFHAFLDEIEEVEDLIDSIPGRHRAFGGARTYRSTDWPEGGWARSSTERHHNEAVRAHARRAVGAVADLIRATRIDRVIAGGTPEVLAEFRRIAPRAMNRRIAAEISVPLFAGQAEILAAVREADRIAERESEERLVTDLLEAIGGDHAVSGAADVLAATLGERVSLLAVDEATHIPGTHCTACGLLDLAPAPEACRLCGSPTRVEPDIAGYMIERVLEQHGRVEQVSGAAAAKLAGLGGIAAFVRYAVVAAPSGSREPVRPLSETR